MGVASALGAHSVKVTDRDGKEHELGPFTLGDIRDIERALGVVSISDAGDALASFDGQIKILWVLLRRENLTRQQVKDARFKKEWPITEEDVAEMFLHTQATEVFNAVAKAMSSGGVEAKPADPPVVPGGA